MLIRVTQADIENGQKTDCYLCPIALAINRAIGKDSSSFWGAQVYRTQLTPHLGYKQVLTPRRVERFIVRFDHNLPVQPFNFRLAVEKRFE
jgi:hypothetical protein